MSSGAVVAISQLCREERKRSTPVCQYGLAGTRSILENTYLTVDYQCWARTNEVWCYDCTMLFHNVLPCMLPPCLVGQGLPLDLKRQARRGVLISSAEYASFRGCCSSNLN